MVLPVAVAAARLLVGTIVRTLTHEDSRRARMTEIARERIAERLRALAVPETEIKTLGIPEVAGMLREMEEKARTRIVRSAVRQGAKVMMARVKDTTYDDNTRKRRTGLMQRNIRVTTKLKGDDVMAFVTPNKRGQKSPFYWWFLERGTAGRDTREGKRGAINPRPWVQPAFSATSSQAIEKISAAIKRGVDREMQRRR